jgi:hypothetical protein
MPEARVKDRTARKIAPWLMSVSKTEKREFEGLQARGGEQEQPYINISTRAMI